MSDQNPQSGSYDSYRDPATVAQRGSPLSITPYSQTQTNGSASNQYQSPGTAQPPSSPFHRSATEPYPPQRGTPMRASTSDVPMSAGYTDGNVRFSKIESGVRSPTGYGDKMKRRHSHEPKVNGYTQCGRHSDEWLFGNFSVPNSVKKLWERDKKA